MGRRAQYHQSAFCDNRLCAILATLNMSLYLRLSGRHSVMNLRHYLFDAPLAIMPDSIIVLEKDEFRTGEIWIQSLSEHPDICGIVMPIELESPIHTYQDAFGSDLLNWLRWSAEYPIRCVPVLAVAFQTLAMILRRTKNLLLVSQGTEFIRLPDAIEHFERFVQNVRGPNAHEYWTNSAEVDRLAGATGSIIQQLSYHDLANEYYSASRLWEGYKQSLDNLKDNIQTDCSSVLFVEKKRVDNIHFIWEDTKIIPLLRKPHVRQYLLLAHNQSHAPIYPRVPDAAQILYRHIATGLPRTTRILLVDDEYDKGLAEVLLQILFRQSTFSIKNGDRELVYVERSLNSKNWARMVCVKTADLALHWLSRWGEVDAPKEDEWTFTVDHKDWLKTWASTLRVKDFGDSNEDDILGENITYQVDNSRGYPKGVNTVILLDLRLDRNGDKDFFDTLSLESVRLRRLIKLRKHPAPIVMLTASRQAPAYASIMGDADIADGWLTKEGPDLVPDNDNSARAVYYLLERLHLFACIHDWYRDELRWNPKWKLEYSKLRDSQNWDNTLIRLGTCARNLLLSMHNLDFQHEHRVTPVGLNWVDHHTKDCSPVERILVSRRVVIAALLETAIWVNNKPQWDIERFNELIPGKYGRERISVKAVYDVVKNFNVKLWLVSTKPDLLRTLLPEEYGWLKEQFPHNRYPDIYRHLTEVSRSTTKEPR